MMSILSSMSIITSMDHLLASPLGMYQPCLIHTLSIKISTRFHQLSKNQTRAFNVSSFPLPAPQSCNSRHVCTSFYMFSKFFLLIVMAQGATPRQCRCNAQVVDFDSLATGSCCLAGNFSGFQANIVQARSRQ
jgi:hypothetical protein